MPIPNVLHHRCFEILRSEWYPANRRDLPWRKRLDDPYAVLVSEIMLQQTRVATVLPYYERWMDRFPTLESLALADEPDVLAHWSGLGYYRRAVNLHRTAQRILEAHARKLPRTEKELLALPGIGRYTAGAIRSLCFGEPAPIVDGNVARVFARVFAIKEPVGATAFSKRAWSLAESLMPTVNPGNHNQALMELGARICKPCDPRCSDCPLAPCCAGLASGEPASYPRRKPGQSPISVRHACGAAVRDGRVLLTQRLNSGLWAGLWELPRLECGEGEPPVDASLRALREVAGVAGSDPVHIGSVCHQVTHYRIRLEGFLVRKHSEQAFPRGCAQVAWVPMADAFALALPSPQRRMLQSLQSSTETPVGHEANA